MTEDNGIAVKFCRYQDLVFSRREVECIYYLIRGLSAKQIGRILNLSSRTIETHVYNIKKKIGGRKKSDVVAWVLDDPGLYQKIVKLFKFRQEQ
ncbi:MAG: helix-turn-helix transcriptional regulator [Pseudomonadota bacterium]